MKEISRFWRVVPIMLVAHVLQTTLFAGKIWALARPDLPFLVALASAMLGGVEVGAIAGVGAGVLDGLAAMWHPGSFFISRLVPPTILGSMSKRFMVNHPVAPPLSAFCATIIADALFLLMSPADINFNWWVRHAVACGVLHAILIWPIFSLVARVVKPPQRSLFA